MLKKLSTIFDQLPPMTINGEDFQPIFRYGTRFQLAEDLSLHRKKGEKYYPLIFLETPIEESEIVDLRFILATLNLRTEMRNKDRMTVTFDEVLKPLRKQVETALVRSKVFKRTIGTPKRGTYRSEYFFNYHVTPDIWDALTYETTLRYDENCQVREDIYFVHSD